MSVNYRFSGSWGEWHALVLPTCATQWRQNLRSAYANSKKQKPGLLSRAKCLNFGGGTRNRTQDHLLGQMVTRWPRERGLDDLAVFTPGLRLSIRGVGAD